jgi:predicted GNAT family N-acyltransferase
MDIRLVSLPSEKHQIYKFRYKVYVDEMNRKQIYADHVSKIIKEPLDDTGHLFAAYDDDGNIIGTIRNNFSKDGNLGFYEKLYNMDSVGAYHPNNTAILTKLMIAKKYRKSSILSKLIMSEAYKSLLNNKIKFSFIDVNHQLVNFFTRYGCKHLDEIIHPEYGEVDLMRLDVEDVEHLYNVGSPLYEVLRIHNEKINLITV